MPPPNLPAIQRRYGVTRSDARRVALFRETIGKDMNPQELDQAIEYCEVFKANPFVKDIYFFIFDKDNPAKRTLQPVLSIQLYRKIAKRTGDYRPDEKPPRITYDEALISPANPKGIVDCEVTVYQFSHGEWHPITERLKWEERAPIKEDAEGGYDWIDTGEKWADTGKPKKKKVAKGNVVAVLDPGKRNWHTMPETMLSKCVEAAAIRKGWPEETEGTYAEGELDQADILDLTATEVAEKYETQERQRKVGSVNAIIIDWLNGSALDLVPEGQLFDRAMEWATAKDRMPSEIKVWRDRNQNSLKSYWATHKSDALELRKKLEQQIAKLEAEDVEPQPKGKK